ncbi:hypothetical protein M569_13696, partial [Genlisea aurea]
PNVYRQDVVRRKNGTEIGIVTEAAGDSDSDGSITDDEDEDEDEAEDDDGDEDKAGGGDDNENGACKVDEEKNVENAVECNGLNENSPKFLNSDQVRVLWIDGSETTECMNDVEVIDRGFLHGDYVASASDPTGQIGIVVDVNTNVDLVAHDGSILRDKPSTSLRRIRDFIIGDYVVLGPWLGRIEDVFDNVTVELDDGSVCRVMRADPLHLKPIGNTIHEDGNFPYYPGQRVKASSSSVFKNSQWLSGLWKANRLEGTVTKVTVASVWIYWIASAGYGPESAVTPDEQQSTKNLKLLSCFTHANWELGDWCFLSSSLENHSSLKKRSLKPSSRHSANDEPESAETGDESELDSVTLNEPSQSTKSSERILGKKKLAEDNNNSSEMSSNNASGQSKKDNVREIGLFTHKKVLKLGTRKDKKARKKKEKFEKALQIINTKRRVDVIWQDGTTKGGLDSVSLIRIESPGDHEFVAEQYVVEKSADSDDSVEARRVGVVQSVNAKDRTACVRWLKPVSKADDPKEFDKEEVVSVYELEGHPDYDYCYGDVVIRLSPITLPADVSDFESSLDTMRHGSSDDFRDEKTILDLMKNIDESPSHEFSSLSWVGNITGLRDGDIEVTWADGMVSTVGPQAIYVVGRDDESMATGSNASDGAASWETVEDDKNNPFDEDNATENAGDVMPDTEDANLAAENSGRNIALSIPMAAISFITRLASGIFSKSRNDLHSEELGARNDVVSQVDDLAHSDSSSKSPIHIENDASQITATSNNEEHVGSMLSGIVESTNAQCNVYPTESDDSSHDEPILTFKSFDIVRDPLDHHFICSHGQTSASRKWLKKVQKDWEILQNNLPGGIYVRVYEDRMDLLRTVTVGAYGTPYQDGLFFFDFYLPPEYPDVPPSVYYHSGGWRINPNLYEEGKVCLSLLNTWTGRGNEVWDPSTSSILQVLVSLQGLVLNSRPYFNEAGYDKHVGTAEGEKNSLSYNENTFLLNCKTMMYLIRKPPKDFEELIIEHFRKRGPYILKACDAYMKGYLIGSLTKDASVSGSNNSSNANSIGFKLMLSKLVPKLQSSLSSVGVDCKEYEHL